MFKLDSSQHYIYLPVFFLHLQLLDLFTIGGQSGGMDQSTWSAPQSLNSTPGSNSSMKVILDSLPDLWDDKDYEEEYDLTNFVRTLKQ